MEGSAADSRQVHIWEQKILQIKNPKNSCYVIAVINLLFSCPHVVNFLKVCEIKQGKGRVIQELRTLLSLQPGNIGSVEKLRGLMSIKFRGSQQQDAAEFMQDLLEHISQEVTTIYKAHFKKLFYTITKEERNCVLAHRNECPIKYSNQTHSILAVPVLNSNTLHKSMSMFLGHEVTETIEARCGYMDCQSKEAELFTKFENLPTALIIQLKRTVPNPRCQTQLMKLNNPITIPLQYKPWSTGPCYILTGAIQQKGNETTSGHYISLTWNKEQRLFTLADDDLPLMNKTQEDANEYLERSYMFMYACQEGEEEVSSTPQSITDDALSSPQQKKCKKEKGEDGFSESDLLLIELKHIQEQRDKLQSIKPNQRTKEQKASLKTLQNKVGILKKKLNDNKGLMEKLSSLFKPKITQDEVRAADRAQKAMEEARAADRAWKATQEGRAATREIMAIEQAKAATREIMATEQAKAATRERMATEKAKAADRDQKATEEARAADRA